MTHLVRTAAAPGLIAAFGLILAACTPPADPPDLCRLPDPAAGTLAGLFIGQPAGVPAFSITPVAGRADSDGRVEELVFDGFVFAARPDAATGGLATRAGDSAAPLGPLTGVVPGVAAYTVAYTLQDGQAFAGQAVIGAATADARVATVGQASYTGPVMLSVSDFAEGADPAPIVLNGTATLKVRFGSRTADLVLGDLKPQAGGALPFRQIIWTDLALCGARVGSSGAGGFAILDAQDNVISLSGDAGLAATERAVLSSQLYGNAQGLGGAILIQGDTGMVSGLFATSPVD